MGLRAREPWLGPSFGRHLSLILLAENNHMDWVLAHGLVYSLLAGQRVRSCIAWLQSADDQAIMDNCQGFMGRAGRFYRDLDVDLSCIVTYDRNTSRSMSVRSGHAGPWEQSLFDSASKHKAVSQSVHVGALARRQF